MVYKVVILLALMAVALAVPGYEHHHHEAHAHPKYEFKYGVNDPHTHDIKEQEEKRDGDKVSGYYKLVEPDGHTRTVHYTADKHSGFVAHVDRPGHHVPVQQHPHGYHFGHGSAFGSY